MLFAILFLAAGIVLGGIQYFSLPAAWGQEGEESQRLEYNVKLAFLCNFGRYVTWPANAVPAKDKDSWIIGVLGNDPFGGALDQLASNGRKIQDRKLVARHFTSMKDYEPCQVLFIPKTVPREQQEAAIRMLRDKPVLIVGESPEFANQGGCVNFYRDGDNVRFEINLEAVRNHHLEVSSKLLNLAKIVNRPPQE